MDELDAKGKYNFSASIKEKFCNAVFKVQKNFCEAVERIEDFKKFSKRDWKTESGYGIIKFLEHEEGVFEKVSVSASVAHGILPTSVYLMLKDKNANIQIEESCEEPKFFTAGLSGVVYPKNPNIPTLNFSYRYLELSCGNEEIWWFSGSTDLIPYILNVDDCQNFHKLLKMCCDEYDHSWFKIFKKNCDEHYYLKHRKEHRGIGGIFFDNFNFPNKEICFQFVSNCMNNIIPIYIPFVKKNKDKNFLHDDRLWQLLLRGRSVEFGLVCDKATEFALLTSGTQCESVLIFLPPLVKWQYDYIPDEKSKEYKLLKILQNPREWV